MPELMNPPTKMIIMVIIGGLITPLKSYTYYNDAKPQTDSLLSYLFQIKNQFHYTQNSPNPDELGSYIEGDIVLSPESQLHGYESEETPAIWEHAIIPYRISSEFYDHPRALDTIYNAMSDFHENTCIRFVRHTIEPDYIEIKADGKGCWSYVGKQGGPQTVNLQIPSCLKKKGTVIHEFMHTLKFFHEHRRSDRDYYIDVHWDNIKENAQVHFEKSLHSKEGLGIEYDYRSVMHYSRFAFSRNGEATILPRFLTRKANDMGQRNGFSAGDILKVNAAYMCPPKNVGSIGSNTTGWMPYTWNIFHLLP